MSHINAILKVLGHMTGTKKVMTVTPSVYKLVKRFSELRVESENLHEGDTRETAIDDEMNTIALAITNHLLLNELRVLS